MNLNQLYYFKTLAELEHYTKAAEKLNISQPTLSHSISSMEKELGANLFEKQGQKCCSDKIWADLYVLCGKRPDTAGVGEKIRLSDWFPKGADTLGWRI